MSPSNREIRIQIDSRLEFIDMIQQATEDVCRAARFGRETVFNLSLAVREAVINAIRHGNRMTREKQVHVVLRLDRDKLSVTVRDEGDGFDFEQLNDPRDPDNLFKSTGRGLFFIRSFVDRVAFSRVNGGGTEVLMEKRITTRRRGRRMRDNQVASDRGGV
jgi:serine/threonine-protein kinase RsbW